MPNIRITHFQRKRMCGAFSVERLFADVRSAMPPDIAVTVRINRFMTKGVLRRIVDALAACGKRGDVNHVLGDVHYLAWFLPRNRTVLTVLDCVSLERMTGMKRWLLWFFWYWWPTKRAGYVTVISNFSREALQEWVEYPSDRIAVIPPPLSKKFSRSPAVERASGPRLLQIGTQSNKNLDRIIKALEGLRITLVVIGRLDDATRVRINKLGIEFENYVNLDDGDLVREYQKADMLVFASTYEGFGMPIIEAQAVGRPVLTSNVCAMPEAAGGAACLVDPFDVADIRRGICRLLDDPDYCQELVERGYDNAALYSPEKIAEQYAAIYRKIHEAQGVSS
jgi:glycosyltransferase involved in cell wall biosynthesis